MTSPTVEDTTPPPAWSELILALALLAKHQNNAISPFHCEHDTLTVMADPEKFTLTCDHCGAIARRHLHPDDQEALVEPKWRLALAIEGWTFGGGCEHDVCPACTCRGDHAMSQNPNHVDPIPAPDAPHAWVAVQRYHSVHADRPEWAAQAVVVPEWDHDSLAAFRRQGRHLLPIGPDGDTGTRAIVEPRRAATIAELAALPVGSIVLANEQAWTLHWPGNGWSVCASCEITYCAEDLLDYIGEPVTVLHIADGGQR